MGNIREFVQSLTAREGPPAAGRLRFHDAPSRKLGKRLEPIWQRALQGDPAGRQDNAMDFSKELIEALMR
jgi:hypothetical protein